MKNFLLLSYFIVLCFVSYGQTPVAKYSFSGDANDEIGNNNGLIYGASLTTDRFGEPDAAYEFDGIDDYIDFGDSSEFRFNTNYSISVWVYIQDVLGQNVGNIVVKRNPNNPYNQYNLAVTADIQFGGNGNQIHFLHKGDNIPTSRILSSPNLSVGWHHLVITQDITNKEIKMYFDNVVVSTTTYTNANEAILEVVGRPFEVGGNVVSSKYFKGKIDDISIYHDVLTATNVNDLYYENNTSSCLIANYTFDGGVMSDDMGIRNGFLGGATYGLDRFGNPNNALKIEGINSDQIPQIAHPIIDPNNDFTVSFWANADSMNTPESLQYLVSSRHDSLGAEQGGLDISFTTLGEVICVLRRANATYLATVKSTPQSANSWHHVVLVRENDSLKLYLNNALVATENIPSGLVPIPTFWTLGASYSSGLIVIRELSGRLDNVRFYCRGLSATEVTNLCTVSTHTTEAEKAANYLIYPNPATDQLTIEIENNDSFVELQLIDVTGQLLQEKTILSTKIQLNIQNLAKGIYWVKLVNEQGELTTKKFIKQ